MFSLLFNLLYLIFQEVYFIGESLFFNFSISLDVLNLEIFFLELIFQLSDVQFLQLCVSILRSFEILDLSHSLVFKSILEGIDFNLFEILHFEFLILEFSDLSLLKVYL